MIPTPHKRNLSFTTMIPVVVHKVVVGAVVISAMADVVGAQSSLALSTVALATMVRWLSSLVRSRRWHAVVIGAVDVGAVCAPIVL